MELYFGEYYKIRSLGDGSFANVLLVRHHSLGYIRALKVSKDTIKDESDKKWQKFMKECRLLLKIGNGGHPNIIKIYQPRLIDNSAVVEMDYVEGKTLHEYIEECQFLPFKEVWKFIKDIIGAMAYCHVDVYNFLIDPNEDGLSLDPLDGRKYDTKGKENELIEKYGVCHNDLHASNIMRRNLDGSYILLDFGLAIQNRQAVNSSNMDKGAIEYSAPEKFDHEEPTIRSDVYSLGILLFKVLTGSVPFPLAGNTEKDKNDVWQAKREKTPPNINDLRKQAFEKLYPNQSYARDYPETFDRIILKCLAVRPEDRYKNAKELLHALEDAYSSFDELSRLDDANVKLSNQLSLAYSRIDEIESSVLQSKKQIEEKERIIQDAEIKLKTEHEAFNNASKKASKWKRKAIFFPIIASLIFGAVAVFTEYKTNTENPPEDLRQPVMDTTIIEANGEKIVERIVRDTVTVRDTVRVEVPKTITQTQTKVEYRTPPDVQNELTRLRARNKELQEQVQRAKSAAQ